MEQALPTLHRSHLHISRCLPVIPIQSRHLTLSCGPASRRITMRAGLTWLLNITFVIVISGCATSGPPPVPVPPTASPASYRWDLSRLDPAYVLRRERKREQLVRYAGRDFAISSEQRIQLRSGASQRAPRFELLPFSDFCGCCRPRRRFQRNKPKWRGPDDWPHYRVAFGWPDQRDGVQLRLHSREILSGRAVRRAVRLRCQPVLRTIGCVVRLRGRKGRLNAPCP